MLRRGGSLFVLFVLLVGCARWNETPVTWEEIEAPPRFVLPDEERLVDTQLFDAGDPRLIVWGDNGILSSRSMTDGARSYWAAPLPRKGFGTVKYHVSYVERGQRVRTPARFLTALDSVDVVEPIMSKAKGTTLLRAPLATEGDDLRFIAGQEGSDVYPSSFAVDEVHGRIHVLDSGADRLVTYDTSGSRVGVVPLESGDTSYPNDVITTPESGRTYILDGHDNRVVELIDDRLEVISVLAIDQEPSPTRLATSGDALYLWNDFGALVPIMSSDGSAIEPSERDVLTSGGITEPSVGFHSGIDIDGDAEEHGFVVGDLCDFRWGGVASECAPGRTRGIRVLLKDSCCNDNLVLDHSGTLWMLGATFSDTDDGERYLFSVDLRTGVVRARTIRDNYIEVERQLAPLKQGVVLMEGDRNSITLTGFDTL